MTLESKYGAFKVRFHDENRLIVLIGEDRGAEAFVVNGIGVRGHVQLEFGCPRGLTEKLWIIERAPNGYDGDSDYLHRTDKWEKVTPNVRQKIREYIPTLINIKAGEAFEANRKAAGIESRADMIAKLEGEIEEKEKEIEALKVRRTEAKQALADFERI